MPETATQYSQAAIIYIANIVYKKAVSLTHISSHMQAKLASKTMSVGCFAERNKEGAARAAGDVRAAEQHAGMAQYKSQADAKASRKSSKLGPLEVARLQKSKPPKQ